MPWQIVHRCSVVFFFFSHLYSFALKYPNYSCGKNKLLPVRTDQIDSEGTTRSETLWFPAMSSTVRWKMKTKMKTCHAVANDSENGERAVPGWLRQSALTLYHAACNHSVSSTGFGCLVLLCHNLRRQWRRLGEPGGRRVRGETTVEMLAPLSDSGKDAQSVESP